MNNLERRRSFGWQLLALSVLRQAWEDSLFPRQEPSDIDDADGLADFLQSAAGQMWWEIAGGEITDSLERRLRVVGSLYDLIGDDVVMRLQPAARRAECAVDMPNAVQVLLFTLREQED